MLRENKKEKTHKKNFENAPTVIIKCKVHGAHLKISVTRDFYLKIIIRKTYSSSIKSVRVGTKNLG